ncbi:hypothetical protein SLE2022_145230 [Rubroshorea leprosula]
MNGQSSRELSQSGAGSFALLKGLTRDEILEVLAEGFCQHCEARLERRIRGFSSNKKVSELSLSDTGSQGSAESLSSLNGSECSVPWPRVQLSEPLDSTRTPEYVSTQSASEIMLNDGLSEVSSVTGNGLSEEQKEQVRLSEVGRKKDFVHMERIQGKNINVVQGLELHTGVFNAEEQKKIVECIYDLQRMGRKQQLRERTYSEPRKWMRGKGRVTIQFGCCYNYAVDKNGNPPGIIRDEEVDPLPPLFKQMIKRMVRWHVLPPTCVPDSCIVNIYDEGDCIPPHIDHHDFDRPFCTVSFLTESNILFGTNLKIVSPGEFSGPVSIPLPVGSVLVLKGNGADVAKHCVPAVPAKRISVTFRKMDDSKLPYRFSPDPELSGIQPFVISPMIRSPSTWSQNQYQRPVVQSSILKSMVQQTLHQNSKLVRNKPETTPTTNNRSFLDMTDDFPPLGSSNPRNRQKETRAGSRQ